MKKISLLLIAFVLLCTACGGTDEPDSTSYNVVGKWKHIKTEFYENNVLVDTETAVHLASCPNYVEFKSDNTFQSILYDSDCTMSIDEQGTYTYQNNTISTTIGGFTENLPVTTLTATEMRVTDTYVESGVTVKEVTYFQRL